MDKEEFLEKAMKANSEAVGQSKISDLTNKDSIYYKGLNVPPPEPVEVHEEAPVDPQAIPRLRTLQGDFEGAVKNDNLSVSRMVLSEKKREQTETEADTTDKPKKSAFFIVSITLAVMLVLGGIGAIGYVFFIKSSEKPEIIKPVAESKSLIRFDNETSILMSDLSRLNLQNKIEKELKNPPAQDYIRYIKFPESEETKDQGSIISWLDGISSEAPDDLLRFLKREFFVGINFIKGKGEPFLIITGEAYENLYPGMLSWEKDMPKDLNIVFKNKDIASSTSPYSFKDAVISNKDVRIYSDSKGLMNFFYSIVDETTVVFAESQTTFDEVLKRLRERRSGR